MPDKRRVFISYAWRDGRAVAEWLYKRFNATEGFSAWMDLKLHADTVFTHTLQMQLDDCDLVVCVVSPDVNRRDVPSFVQKELQYATQPQINKPVFPVKAENCAVPLIIAGFLYVEFYPPGEDQYESAFHRLIEGIEKAPRAQPSRPSQREQELAYLRSMARDHSIFGKIYVDTGATTRVRNAAPEVAMIDDPDIDDFLGEVLTKVHADKHHSADDAAGAKLETYEKLSQALSTFERVAIIGDPGSGKTTTLRRFAYDFAESAAREREHLAEGQPTSAPLPLFVPLGGYEGGDLTAYMERFFGGLALSEYLPDRVIILFDGLNETTVENSRRVQSWLDANPKARVMLSCRKLDYVERKLALQRVDVLPLDLARIRQFMSAYKLSEAARDALFWGLAGAETVTLWEKFKSAGQTFDQFWHGAPIDGHHPVYLAQTDKSRYDAMRESFDKDDKYPGLLGLVRNPFLLKITIAIYKESGKVPRNRTELFKAFVRLLFDERGKPAARIRPPWIDEAVQHHALAVLAHQMQWQNKGTLVDAAWAQRVITTEQPGVDAAHLLYLAGSAGIIELGETVKFTHQLLQEYFAAFEMGEDIRRGVPTTKYFPGDEWWKPTGWEETAMLLAGTEGDSTRVVEWLTPVQPTLAYRCALESGASCSEPALNALLEPSPDPGVRRDPILSAEAGRRMAQRGDYRPGMGLRADGLPDLVWCPVPAGKFISGDGHELDIPYEYAIAKYPVTYAQYAAFVDSDGYTNKRYWTDAGWTLREKQNALHPTAYWNHSQWHIANHPAVGVTWYEAYAFCKWLSAKTGQEIRLPTEAEWEKAARGKDGLIYPYGNTFDPSKGNTSESQIGRTSAVGIFPGGASPYGVLDMSGNVWEWCQSKYASSYQFPEDNDGNGTDDRVLRGGSWFSDPDVARAVTRSGDLPNFRDWNLGFRCARS